jgi:hypothetical protein
MAVKVRGVKGDPFAKLADVALDKRVLRKLGSCLVGLLRGESQNYFEKRGWSGKDPMGGPPIWRSFSYRVVGSDLEILSSFYGMKELAKGDIPSREMPWLTQEAKDKQPLRYHLTDTEKRLRMRRNGRISNGKRKPLIVPIKTKAGEVIFRMAPLKLKDAWVHPGIARFTFLENAIRKGRKMCARIIAAEMAKAMKGDQK